MGASHFLENRTGRSVKEAWKKWGKQIKTDTYALYLAYRDPRTPWYAKAFSALVVGYAFSPIDLIPDFIPILGYLDDLLLVPLGILLAIKMIPAPVMADCREKAQEQMSKNVKSNWIAAVVIGMIWIAILAWMGMVLYSKFKPF
jgi:uncharacterized membrane protein YkvA (DUF1232 family)